MSNLEMVMFSSNSNNLLLQTIKTKIREHLTVFHFWWPYSYIILQHYSKIVQHDPIVCPTAHHNINFTVIFYFFFSDVAQLLPNFTVHIGICKYLYSLQNCQFYHLKYAQYYILIKHYSSMDIMNNYYLF